MYTVILLVNKIQYICQLKECPHYFYQNKKHILKIDCCDYVYTFVNSSFIRDLFNFKKTFNDSKTEVDLAKLTNLRYF